MFQLFCYMITISYYTISYYIFGVYKYGDGATLFLLKDGDYF